MFIHCTVFSGLPLTALFLHYDLDVKSHRSVKHLHPLIKAGTQNLEFGAPVNLVGSLPLFFGGKGFDEFLCQDQSLRQKGIRGSQAFINHPGF
jgi:hypothetical protein